MRVNAPFLSIILAIFTALAGPAMASAQAVAFVQERVSRVLNILSDAHLDETQKSDQFQKEILQITDVNVIARFVLGQFAATASTNELEEFRRIFRQYALNTYQSELSRFGSEVLQVQSSEDRRPGDTVVLTTISGGAMQGKTRHIKWRVLNIKGALRVVDIEISGVWLSQHQRAEITGIIAKNGGRISAASKALCQEPLDCSFSG